MVSSVCLAQELGVVTCLPSLCHSVGGNKCIRDLQESEDRHTSFYCTLLYYTSQSTAFLQIEGKVRLSISKAMMIC